MKTCRNCGAEALSELLKNCHACGEFYNKQLFNSANAVDALRSNKFSTMTAFCEVIDNSVEADAGTVNIKVEDDGRLIHTVVFGDDGIGMPPNVLEGCLSIGESTRSGDQSESGLGRFGVGMKFAAFNQCKRCRVWSKTANGEWHHTYVDLDEVERGEMTELPEPVNEAPPDEFAGLAGKKQGTLVVWDKYDRSDMAPSDIKQRAPLLLGRIYRYFLWNSGPKAEPIPGRSRPMIIKLNGQAVHAVDPLYHRRELTRFPEDPQSDVFEDQMIEWPVDNEGIKVRPGGQKPPAKSSIRVRFSVLPEDWRPYAQASGKDPYKTILEERGIARDSRGISILRNYREVYFGEIDGRTWRHTKPTGWSRFEDKDRWWGCEILFDAWLDRAFDVSNVKGATPTAELRSTIKGLLIPSRNTAIERVDALYEKNRELKRRERQQAEEAETERRKHAEAERVAKITPTSISQKGADIDEEEGLSEWMSGQEAYADAEEQARIQRTFEANPFIIEETAFAGSAFFEATHMGGKAILEYNMRHAFFDRLNDLLEGIAELDDEGRDTAEELKIMIDLLVIAYAKAEGSYSPGTKMTSDEFHEDMRLNWGRFLSSYLARHLDE